MLLSTSLLPQTDNGNESAIDAPSARKPETDKDRKLRNKDDFRVQDTSHDLGPLGTIEKHAPTIYEVLTGPEWQELDEIGKYRVLVPQLRIEWGLEPVSSKVLLETLDSIDRVIAGGKHKRLARYAKQVIGWGVDSLFDRFVTSLEFVAIREGLWKDSEKWMAISPDEFNDYFDCVQGCKSKLNNCFAQSEAAFERDVIGTINDVLSAPEKHRDVVRKWRDRSPFLETMSLNLSTTGFNLDFLSDGGDCNDFVLRGLMNTSAQVSSPKEPVDEPPSDSVQDEELGDSAPGGS